MRRRAAKTIGRGLKGRRPHFPSGPLLIGQRWHRAIASAAVAATAQHHDGPEGIATSGQRGYMVCG